VKVSTVPDAPHLAEISESQQAGGAGECLSVFFAAGENPAECLSDPHVICDRPAVGHWQLLGMDEQSRRAYYARIEHGEAFDCDRRSDIRGARSIA
jgi:hypothetical protein